jgi:hypothetical protein
MPREKHSANCQHCGEEFTKARKDQKYCKAECRFEHFFEKRDNEKARLEEQIAALQEIIGERNMSIDVLTKMVNDLEARLQAARKPKKTKPEMLTS